MNEYLSRALWLAYAEGAALTEDEKNRVAKAMLALIASMPTPPAPVVAVDEKL